MLRLLVLLELIAPLQILPSHVHPIVTVLLDPLQQLLVLVDYSLPKDHELFLSAKLPS